MLLDKIGSVERILAVRLDNIGDVVMLGPALRSLRGAFPSARLTLMTSPAGSQVSALLPWVDDTLVWRAVWQDISKNIPVDPAKEYRLVDMLKMGRFDAAIIFTSFSQSPYPPAYICYLAGIPIRIGQSKEFGGGLLTHWVKPLPDQTHQVDRNLHLLAEVGIPEAGRQMELFVSNKTQESADERLRISRVDPCDPFIAVSPGASCAARRYDPVKFARVVELLAKETELPIVVLGSQKEKDVLGPSMPVARKNGRIVPLMGQTTVPEYIGIIKRSRLVISNNSSSLHIADAFKRPLVVLYSGTEYLKQWEPRFAPSRVLNRPTGCSPCFRFQCPYQMECLDISPEEVVREVCSLLEDPVHPVEPAFVRDL